MIKKLSCFSEISVKSAAEIPSRLQKGWGGGVVINAAGIMSRGEC